MDEGAHEVTRNGHVVALTITELILRRFFLLNPRYVLSKIPAHVGGTERAGRLSQGLGGKEESFAAGPTALSQTRRSHGMVYLFRLPFPIFM